MKSTARRMTRWIKLAGSGTMVAVCCLALPPVTLGQALLLSGWENPNEIEPNDPWPVAPLAPADWAGEPALASWPSGRWYAKDANGNPVPHGSDVRLFHSTSTGVVSDDADFPGSTGALQIVQGGSSRGGGNTHYNFTAAGTYLVGELSGFPADPRGLALLEALGTSEDPSPTLNHRFEFDLTIDFESMGARDPETGERAGWFDGPFFGVGLYMSTGVSAGGNDWITNSAWIGSPNDFDGVQTFHIEVPFPQDVDPSLPSFKPTSVLNGWRNAPNLDQPALAVGFVVNGNWLDGDVDAPGGGMGFYVDNLKLVEFCPACEALERIDFDESGTASPGDWELFMQNHLLAGDEVIGDINGDGVNDFQDYVQFLADWQLAYTMFPFDGVGSAELAAAVPEPSSTWLWLAGLAGATLLRRRFKIGTALPLAALVVGMSDGARAQETLLESWEVGLGGWAQVSPPEAGNVGTTTAQSTHGSSSLFITQSGDEAGTVDHAFVTWATEDAQYDALTHAVNLGAEHFRLLMDVIYVPASLPEVETVGVSLAIGSTLGFNRVGETDETALVPWVIGEGMQVKTIDRPLSDWNPLGDAEADGNELYQLAIGLNGLQTPGVPFTVYFDNLRLEQVSQPDWLTLEVNRDTGEVQIKNDSPSAINLSYYEIRSESGSLDKDSWISLQDQGIDSSGAAGDGWHEAGGSDNHVLVEARFPPLGGESTLAPSQSWSLGNVFAGQFSSHEDLVFQYRNEARPNKLIGGGEDAVDFLVSYLGAPLPPDPIGVAGDYNDNGVVDAADYTIWRDHLGTDFPLPNEGGVTPGQVTPEDYDFWRSRFGAVSGSGSALGGVAAVPEPSTVAVAIWAIAAAAFAGRRMS